MSVTITIKQDRSGQFELNVANRNFATLWSALAIPFDWCGEIDGRRILDALNVSCPTLVCRETVVDGTFISYGITADQADRYHAALRCIAEEAAKRESLVEWF